MTKKAAGLYFDDIIIGQKFISKTHQIDAEQIIAFAKQFDPQPFHLDNEAAKESLFGGLVASGWHTSAITMRLIVGDGSPFAGGTISKGCEINWLRPVRPGDILQVESEIIDKIPSSSNSPRGTIIMKSQTKNQDGEVVQLVKSRRIVPVKV